MFEHDDGSGREQEKPRDRAGVRVDLLERMGVLSERLTANLLAPYRLTAPQARVLQAMYRHGPDLPLHEIASVTGFPLGALTSIMDRLLLRGLVEQKLLAGFSHRVTISITPEGQEMVISVREARSRLLARIIDGLPDEDLAAIGRLAARLEQEVSASSAEVHERAPSAPVPMLRLIKRSEN